MEDRKGLLMKKEIIVKKIRHLLPLLLAIFMLALAGCGKQEVIADDYGLVTPGTLTMATNAYFPPYEYYEGSEIRGIDAEIAALIAEELGLTLKIEDMEFDSIVTAVQLGKVDLGMAGMTVTEDRLKNVAFSSTYTTAKQVIIVPEGSEIMGPDDLADKLIGVQLGTTGDVYAVDDYGQEHVDEYNKGNDAILALTSGKVDAVIIDYEPAKKYVAANPGLQILETEYVIEEYAIALNLGNDALEAAVNETLKTLTENGKIQEIIDFYISDEEHVDVENLSFLERFRNDFIQKDRWKFITDGLLTTLIVTVCALVIGAVIGMVIATIRCAHDQADLNRMAVLPRVLLQIGNAICKLYVTVIRGTPALVQLLIMFFIIMVTCKSKILVAIVTFAINSGAYNAEIFRGGIMAVDQGQMEAGRSLGFSYVQTMIQIVLPQAMKSVLPSLANEFISLLKETSICGYIGINELTRGGDIIRGATFDALLPLFAVAIIYLVIVLGLTSIFSHIERRLAKSDHR